MLPAPHVPEASSYEMKINIYDNINKRQMMKKLLVMVAAAMMAAASVNAQDEQRHEVGAFYGIESASNILSVYSSMFSAAAGDQSSWWGPAGVEYYYHISPVVAVGGVAVFAGCEAENEKTKQKEFKESFFTIMPSVKFNWLRKKNWGMYSGLSAGVMFLSLKANDDLKEPKTNVEDEHLTSFMFQATALGAEFGGKLRGFVELGLGEKGTLCGGLRYKF